MKKNTFSMLDENGNEVVYDVLFTFESDETGKNYIVYTDNQRDIADPWYTGNFDKTFEDIMEGLEGFIKHLGYDMKLYNNQCE